MNFKGLKVLVRTENAGVHFGTLVTRNGSEVLLENSIRIWYWEGAFTLSAVSQNGISKKSKLSIPVPQIEVLGAIEIIPCSEKAIESIESIPAHNPA